MCSCLLRGGCFSLGLLNSCVGGPFTLFEHLLDFLFLIILSEFLLTFLLSAFGSFARFQGFTGTSLREICPALTAPELCLHTWSRTWFSLSGKFIFMNFGLICITDESSFGC